MNKPVQIHKLFDDSHLIYMHGNTPADYRECKMQYTQVSQNESPFH